MLLFLFFVVEIASANQCTNFYSPQFQMIDRIANIDGLDFSYRKIIALKSDLRFSEVPELKDKMLVQVTTSGHIRLVYNSIRFDTSGRPGNLNLLMPMRTTVKTISLLEDGIIFIINLPPSNLKDRIEKLIEEYPGQKAFTCATGACRAFVKLTDSRFIDKNYLAPTTVLKILLLHSLENQSVSVLSFGEDLNDAVRLARNKVRYWRANGILGGANEIVIAGITAFGLHAVIQSMTVK